MIPKRRSLQARIHPIPMRDIGLLSVGEEWSGSGKLSCAVFVTRLLKMLQTSYYWNWHCMLEFFRCFEWSYLEYDISPVPGPTARFLVHKNPVFVGAPRVSGDASHRRCGSFTVGVSSRSFAWMLLRDSATLKVGHVGTGNFRRVPGAFAKREGGNKLELEVRRWFEKNRGMGSRNFITAPNQDKLPRRDWVIMCVFSLDIP